MRKETKINLILVSLFLIIAVVLYAVIFERGGDVASGGGGSVIAALNSQPPISQAQKPIPGHVAPDFSIQTMEGRNFRLSEQRGKVVFLNFFATWCAPCQMEAAQLGELNARFADRDFVMLAVSSENGFRQALPRFSAQFKRQPLFAEDAGGKLIDDYRVSGFPETYLIDKTGNIVRRFIGPYDWTSAEFTALIGQLLAQ